MTISTAPFWVPPLHISTMGRYSVGVQARKWSASSANQAWTANQAMYIPLAIPGPIVVDQLYWCNGSTATNTVSVAIYDESWNRLVTTGSTSQSGVATIQYVDITDYLLAAGRYYMGFSCSSTSTFLCISSGALRNPTFGVLQQSTAHALPNPATPVVTANTYYPVCGIKTKWS